MKNYIDNLLRQIALVRRDNPINNDVWAACDTVEKLLWQAKYQGSISPSIINRAIAKSGLPIGKDQPR
jgi:hypothetical protein